VRNERKAKGKRKEKREGAVLLGGRERSLNAPTMTLLHFTARIRLPANTSAASKAKILRIDCTIYMHLAFKLWVSGVGMSAVQSPSLHGCVVYFPSS